MEKPTIITNLQKEAEENPSLTLGALGAALVGTAKLIDAVSSARSRAAYAKAVKHRTSKK